MYSNYGYDYYNTYNSYDYDTAAAGLVGGFAVTYMIFMLCLSLISIAVSVVEIIAMWKVFKKAGRGGWEAIIPFYNMWTLFEISGIHGAKIFFGFIPVAGPIILLVYEIKAAISLSKKFHKSGGFAVLLILLSVVGYCILGFGNAEYDGKLGLQK
jgi:hypothetical protein